MRRLRSSRGRSAFTLVEIAVALGIIAFCLAGIIGLMGVATSANRDTDRDTCLVSMSTQILDEFRALPFDLLGFASPRDHLTDSYTTSPANAPADSVYYFAVDGTELSAAPQAGAPAGTIYRCTVHKVADDPTRSYLSTGATGGNCNLLQLELRFEWPVDALAARRQTKSIYATVARY